MAGEAIGGNMALVRRGSPGVEIVLTHYPANGHQDRHEHDHVQVSFLLAGGIQETIGKRCHEMTVSAACIKPIGADHENAWGPAGALMLSVRLSDWDEECAPGFDIAHWRRVTRPRSDLIASAIAAQSPSEIDDAATDFVGALSLEERDGRRAQGWLLQVKEALWDGEDLNVRSAAAMAGVHRVHLARVFARDLGMSFSSYRRHVKMSRAVDRTLRTSRPFADLAASCGFADQAHMTRCIGAATGVTPRRLRFLFV